MRRASTCGRQIQAAPGSTQGLELPHPRKEKDDATRQDLRGGLREQHHQSEDAAHAVARCCSHTSGSEVFFRRLDMLQLFGGTYTVHAPSPGRRLRKPSMCSTRSLTTLNRGSQTPAHTLNSYRRHFQRRRQLCFLCHCRCPFLTLHPICVSVSLDQTVLDVLGHFKFSHFPGEKALSASQPLGYATVKQPQRKIRFWIKHPSMYLMLSPFMKSNNQRSTFTTHPPASLLFPQPQAFSNTADGKLLCRPAWVNRTLIRSSRAIDPNRESRLDLDGENVRLKPPASGPF